MATTRFASLFGDLWLDLRHAARACLKQPAFTATTVLTLALGIGATTAMFGVVYGVLLKPLPFRDPDALVSVIHRGAINGTIVGRNHGPATFLTYREQQRAFEALGAWDTREVSITAPGEPDRVEALVVSDTTLPLLRVQPILGRAFTSDDDAPGRPLRAILTYGYWQQRFAGATTVVGQPLTIDGRPVDIIGVLPASFRFLRTDAALLLPMQLDPSAPRGISFGFQALARLKPGVDLANANEDLRRMIELLPPAFAGLQLQPNVRPLVEDVIGDTGRILWILLAAVGLVLLIACGNVTNLFLIRAEGRQQELAMRAALGANRSRLARALLAESVTLALVGGMLGLVLAQATIALLQRIAPAELPRVEDIGINTTVLLFTLGLSVLSGLVFGLFAVLRFGAPGTSALKDGGRSASDAPGRHRTRHALVITQVALTLTLLITAGLMIRTVLALREVQPGFTQPTQVQTFRLAIPEGLVPDPLQAAQTYERISERLAQVPGVTSVGLSSSITMDGEDNGNSLHVEEVPIDNPPLRRYKTIGPGYVETMGSRIVAGRPISWSEIYERRPVIMVSETLAREYWQDPSQAIGKRVRGYVATAPWREIVGVVGDERDDGLSQAATPIVYWPILNETYRWRVMAYAVRSTRVGTPAFVRELQQAVWSVNPSLPFAAVQTLGEIQARSMAQTSFAMVMLAIAASVALLLGIVGIYGVIAYIAMQRTREIGIRMALGATIGDVRTMFLRHGLQLTAAGIIVGIGAAMAVTRVLSALLFGVSATDPMTYAAISTALALVALLATYIPARRAAHVDPVVALRGEA